MTGATCKLCGVIGYCETHHIIFKSQGSYMRMIKMNLVPLCMECHRGNHSPHKSKEIDIKLKLQLQGKYEEMFSNKFYSREEIQQALECTDFDTTLILKKLTLYRMGYESEQLLRRLLGGRMY